MAIDTWGVLLYDEYKFNTVWIEVRRPSVCDRSCEQRLSQKGVIAEVIGRREASCWAYAK